MKFLAEYTDTFCGDPNYSWVIRRFFEAPDTASDRLLMRRAKAAVGLSGVKGMTTNHSMMLEFRPYKSSTVMFVTVIEEAQYEQSRIGFDHGYQTQETLGCIPIGSSEARRCVWPMSQRT